VLPEAFPGYTVHLSLGPARAVFWIDCDGRLDIHRLRQVMETYIRDKFFENSQGGYIHERPPQEPREQELEEIVRASLSRVYVFRPTSAVGLLCLVKGIPTFLSKAENQNLTLGLICIDSLTAFHHILRPLDYLAEYYARLASALRSLSSLFNVPVITTSWALYTPREPPDNAIGGRGYIGTGPSHPHSASLQHPVWRHYFPSEWLLAVSKRIILQRKDVRGFVVGMSIVEAEMKREERMDVVRKGALTGWVEDDERREFEMFIVEAGVRF
jgi:hypothetical protein